MNAIETPRTILRNFHKDDWEALLEMILLYQASEVAAYDHPWPTTPGEIQGAAAWFASGDDFLAVCLKATRKLIGLVALNPETEVAQKTFHLGYVFHSDVHGQGYATEACRAVLRRAFEQLQAEIVVTGTAAANHPSCRLLARLGFVKTAESTGSLRNSEEGTPITFVGVTYTLTKAAWDASQPA